jgi:2',3'-cyclic-nucleotide 2'-phosphodiesterase (5'-nucleotidase family)
VLLLACAPHAALPAPPPLPAEVGSELVVEGRLEQRTSRSPADLVLHYGGEHRGSLETCGCPRRPRGSLARWKAYMDAAEGAALRVHAGAWLEDPTGFDGALRLDVLEQDRWMVQGLTRLGLTALNLAYSDIPALARVDPVDLPVVSANVEGPGVARWVTRDVGGVRVGITGVTAVGATLGDAPGFVARPPASAAAALEELSKQVDVVVLLTYGASEAAAELARREPAVDVVIDAASHRETAPPRREGRAVVVESVVQTMRAGELRLKLEHGRVVGGLDRKVDLDPEVPDDPELGRLTREARTALDRIQKQEYAR